MFTVYIIEHVTPTQFYVQSVANVVSGSLIQNGVSLILESGSEFVFTSRNPITVTRAWDELIPSTP